MVGTIFTIKVQYVLQDHAKMIPIVDTELILINLMHECKNSNLGGKECSRAIGETPFGRSKCRKYVCQQKNNCQSKSNLTMNKLANKRNLSKGCGIIVGLVALMTSFKVGPLGIKRQGSALSREYKIPINSAIQRAGKIVSKYCGGSRSSTGTTNQGRGQVTEESRLLGPQGPVKKYNVSKSQIPDTSKTFKSGKLSSSCLEKFNCFSMKSVRYINKEDSYLVSYARPHVGPFTKEDYFVEAKNRSNGDSSTASSKVLSETEFVVKGSGEVPLPMIPINSRETVFVVDCPEKSFKLFSQLPHFQELGLVMPWDIRMIQRSFCIDLSRNHLDFNIVNAVLALSRTTPLTRNFVALMLINGCWTFINGKESSSGLNRQNSVLPRSKLSSLEHLEDIITEGKELARLPESCKLVSAVVKLENDDILIISQVEGAYSSSADSNDSLQVYLESVAKIDTIWMIFSESDWADKLHALKRARIERGSVNPNVSFTSDTDAKVLKDYLDIDCHPEADFAKANWDAFKARQIEI